MTDDQLARFDRCFKERRLDAAIEVIEEAIRANESDWNALYLAGIIKRFSGDFRSAVQFYNLALQHNSQDPAILQALGIAHQHLREFPQAIKALSRAIELDPDSYEAHNSLGLTHNLAGDFHPAMQAYEHALEVCANKAFAEVKRDHPEYFRIEQQGEKRVMTADRAYMKAMRDILVTEFNYFNTVKNMITCCYEMGDERKARELQEHVDSCTPINADIIGLFKQT